MALGVIAGKCGSLRLVLAGPVGCLRGRWRSGPRKWRHDAVSRVRVSKHRAPVGALRPSTASRSGNTSSQVSKRCALAGVLRCVGMFLAHSNVGVWQYSAFEFSLGCGLLVGDLCLRREAPRPEYLGACLRVEVCGVSGAGSRFGANGSEPVSRPWSDRWNHAVSPRGAGAPNRVCSGLRQVGPHPMPARAAARRDALAADASRAPCFLPRTRFLCWTVWDSWSAFHGRRPLTPA